MAELKDEPFAMLGVNSWTHKPGALKEAMKREDIPWRTFDDGRDGAINDRWNRPATPAFYLIDKEGVIRRKWTGNPGEEAIEKNLSLLLGSR